MLPLYAGYIEFTEFTSSEVKSRRVCTFSMLDPARMMSHVPSLKMYLLLYYNNIKVHSDIEKAKRIKIMVPEVWFKLFKIATVNKNCANSCFSMEWELYLLAKSNHQCKITRVSKTCYSKRKLFYRK